MCCLQPKKKNHLNVTNLIIWMTFSLKSESIKLINGIFPITVKSIEIMLEQNIMSNNACIIL